MGISLKELQTQVESQQHLIPSLYGDIDFNIVPERFTNDPNIESALPSRYAKKYRKSLLSDIEKVERAKAYTMLGDRVADAYAALIPEYGFKKLIFMLQQACDRGLENVPDAPQELIAFIQSMERIPDWVDLELVEKGARYSRIHMAILVPFAIRGTFIATFMNKYSGLPMALTGALSSEASVQRVNETASFFTTASLPKALTRYGVGFKAAAMVRLMHSMVRFNLLKKSQQWDVATYGIPIPQVDQMPAGTIPSFLMAFNAIRSKRNFFNNRERAVVELCRYQSYLLGLPEELLPATPQEIFDVMLTYSATLRDGYDDKTCGELVRATMAGYRPNDKSITSRIYNSCERSFAKVFFQRAFLSGNDKPLGKIMGVQPDLLDYALFMIVQAYVLPQMVAHRIAMEIPALDQLADNWLVKRINELLVSYGHPEFTTDESNYRHNHHEQQSHEMMTADH
ncbi:MAG: oxygenase MpaB family protein [Pseudomonadales bacterium]|nr:oxygenase MpaB family protein [Pseudomonadales bacterium]